MKKRTRVKRGVDALADLGIELSDEERAILDEKFALTQAKKEEKIIADSSSREAESVLALIARQDLFTAKFCRECRGPFATNFTDVAYCSDKCRQIALEKRGITWNRYKHPEDRWGYNGPRYHDDEGKEHNVPFPAPLVVSPEALAIAAHNPEIQRFFKECLLEMVVEDPTPDQKSPPQTPEPPKLTPAEQAAAELADVLQD